MPTGAVPHTGDGEDQHHGEEQLPQSIAEVKNIVEDVFIEKAGNGDVPPSPERGKVPRLIGGIKVDGQMHTEERTQTPRHIDIAGKVKIIGERVAQHAHPGFHRGCRGHIACIKGGGIVDHGVGEQDLLCAAHGKEKDTAADIRRGKAAQSISFDLRDQLVLFHHGADDQLREKADGTACTTDGTPGNSR